jgi:hypothetical protein
LEEEELLSAVVDWLEEEELLAVVALVPRQVFPVLEPFLEAELLLV